MKATILKVGKVYIRHGRLFVTGWEMDCRGEVPVLEMFEGCWQELNRLGGWTIRQLRAIARAHRRGQPID